MKKSNAVVIFFVLITGLLFYGCEKPQVAPQQKVEETTPLLKEEVVQQQEAPAVILEKTDTKPVTGASTTITGVVRYEGVVPKFNEIKMDADPICLTKHAGTVLPQTLVLGDGQTMANVFVYVSNGVPKRNYPVPSVEVVVDQKGCMYEPHVLGVMVGQPVKILNPDGTLHNVHAMPKINAEFNLAMPKFRTEVVQNFNKAEFMFPIKCDVHPWMGAWISVMDHPFFAVTKEDGTFTINDLPPGEYEVTAWHEKLGAQKQTIKIDGAGAQTVSFTFSKP